MQAQVDQQRAQTAHLAELRVNADVALQEMEAIAGVRLRPR
jgi:hypothetical protein